MVTLKTRARLLALGILFALCPRAGLSAIAVEYELDQPIDLAKKWSFIRAENFFVQHQCGDERGKKQAARIANLLNNSWLSPEQKAAAPLLQVRLFAGHGVYRAAFKFSRERHGHYNERLHLATSYCGSPPGILEEQLTLHQLSVSHLRLWQKIFIAEIFPYFDGQANVNPFADAAKNKPKPLGYVLLSNHRPEKAERATLRRLALFLQKHQKLEPFLRALLAGPHGDDTGSEILEGLFGETLKNLEDKITPPEAPKNANNTLPGRK